MRIGTLFIDLNTTDRVHHRAEILQLSATNLSRWNKASFDEYAYPKGRIHPGSINFHGITKRRGNLYRDGEVIDDFFSKEEYLIEDFCEFLSRYDTVYLVHHSPWKWSMLDKALVHYDFSRPEEIYHVDLMKLVQNNQEDLNIDGFSMNNIITSFDNNEAKKDARDNDIALKRCAHRVANILGENIKEFLDVA